MTQVGTISNPNTTNISTDNIIKNNDDSLENIIDAGLKQDFEKETSLEKMEELGGPKPAKPESTMHKVGRFLTGILGGLLLAAGVAAAVAATVASCGLAAGVVAGVAATVVGAVGVTGASVIAGAAGAAGIGLIATAARMRPRNPEALLPQQKTGTQQQTVTQQKAKPLKFGEGQIQGVEASLKKLDKNFKAEALPGSATGDMGLILDGFEQVDDTGAYLVKSGASSTNYVDFINHALGAYGVTDFQVNEKNVLLARLAINQFFADDNGYTDEINSFNNKETVASIRDFLKKNMEDYKPGGKNENPATLAKLQIFLAALTGEGVGGPSSGQGTGMNAGIIADNEIINEDKSRNDALNVKQEVIIPGNGLMDDLLQGQNLNVVSMNPQPPQDKTIFAEGEEGKILHELKTFDPNFDGKVKPSFDDAADVFDGYSKSAGWISSLSEYPIDSFVDSVMRKNGVTDSSAQSILQKNPANPDDLLTRKNVLIMRHAIIQYFNKFPVQRNGVQDVLNSAEGRQQFDNAIEGLINKAKTPEVRARLQIFRVAMTKDEDAIQ